eukprot:Rhum_TRINITY_DN14605_c4_g2::Rhum_TRINITY_DN14605_c4_g2_i1::g.103729::m.103729
MVVSPVGRVHAVHGPSLVRRGVRVAQRDAVQIVERRTPPGRSTRRRCLRAALRLQLPDAVPVPRALGPVAMHFVDEPLLRQLRLRRVVGLPALYRNQQHGDVRSRRLLALHEACAGVGLRHTETCVGYVQHLLHVVGALLGVEVVVVHERRAAAVKQGTERHAVLPALKRSLVLHHPQPLLRPLPDRVHEEGQRACVLRRGGRMGTRATRRVGVDARVSHRAGLRGCLRRLLRTRRQRGAVGRCRRRRRCRLSLRDLLLDDNLCFLRLFRLLFTVGDRGCDVARGRPRRVRQRVEDQEACGVLRRVWPLAPREIVVLVALKQLRAALRPHLQLVYLARRKVLHLFAERRERLAVACGGSDRVVAGGDRRAYGLAGAETRNAYLACAHTCAVDLLLQHLVDVLALLHEDVDDQTPCGGVQPRLAVQRVSLQKNAL